MLAFVSDERSRDEEAELTGVKRKGRRPDVNVYLRNVAYKRGDRSKSGVDGYRYCEEVLKPHLLPFCQLLNKHGRKVLVLEDKAGNHRNPYCDDEYYRWVIERIDWPPHSPDLNPIEKAWAWCRRWLRQHEFYAKNRAELEDGWKRAWEALPQPTIDSWFEELPELFRKVKEVKGGSNFNS